MSSLADYANVERLLQSVPGVRRANVAGAAAGSVTFAVTVRGGAAGLEQALTGSAHLVRVRGAHAQLVYRYQPAGLRLGASALPLVRHLPNLICSGPPRAHLADRRGAARRRATLAALWLFIAAAVSDGLDGYLAKRFNWTSELGKFLDPLADKLLLVTVFVECAWLGLVPWWLTAAVVARDVMIALGALVFRLWFGPLRGRPTVLSKINTAAQLLYLMLVMLQRRRRPAAAGGARGAARSLTLATTVLSGVHYIQTFTRRAWARPARTA